MVSDKQLVLIVYLLYLATYIFGITALDRRHHSTH